MRVIEGQRGLWLVCLIGILGVSLAEGAAPTAPVANPVRWIDVVRTFENEDLAWRPPANSIVFTGSSSIVFWKTIHEDMAPFKVINRGFGGSTMADAVHWLGPLVLKHKPQAVVLYEGDNDIGIYGATPEKVRDGFVEFVTKIQAELPETRIYFLAIKPSVARWELWPRMKQANDLIRAVCEQRRKLRFIDTAAPMLDEGGQPRPELFEADKLHMSAAGYAIWTSVVKPVLAEGIANKK